MIDKNPQNLWSPYFNFKLTRNKDLLTETQNLHNPFAHIDNAYFVEEKEQNFLKAFELGIPQAITEYIHTYFDADIVHEFRIWQDEDAIGDSLYTGKPITKEERIQKRKELRERVLKDLDKIKFSNAGKWHWDIACIYQHLDHLMESNIYAFQIIYHLQKSGVKHEKKEKFFDDYLDKFVYQYIDATKKENEGYIN